LRVEIYNKVKEDVEKWFEHVIDELRRSGLDEKTVKSIAKAVAGQEAAKLHSIVMEEIDRIKSKVEELSRQGVDAELIKQMINEIYNRLLNDLTNIIDQRIIHLAQIVEEKSSDIKDILDLINELFKAEAAFEEEFERLRAEIRSVLSEEALEEHLYRALIKHGIIRRRKRRWVPLIAGLSVLAAIIAGFIINPIVTFVIIAIAIVILLRW
jgi:uncharacterized protein with von Willebrand factor type A (vWA) domain